MLKKTVWMEYVVATGITLLLDVLLLIPALLFTEKPAAFLCGLGLGSTVMLVCLFLMKQMLVTVSGGHNPQKIWWLVLRAVLIAGTLILGICSPAVHAAAVVLPFLYQRSIITVLAFLKYDDETEKTVVKTYKKP